MLCRVCVCLYLLFFFLCVLHCPSLSFFLSRVLVCVCFGWLVLLVELFMLLLSVRLAGFGGVLC